MEAARGSALPDYCTVMQLAIRCWMYCRRQALPKGPRPACLNDLKGSPGLSTRTIAQNGRQLPTMAASDIKELQYWDVVTYKPTPDSTTLRLGIVEQVGPAGVLIQPLVKEDEGGWVLEEQVYMQEVLGEQVQQTVEHSYGQRQDKEGNPHGEHAHDVWQMLCPLPPNIISSQRGG
eukprot:GHRR01000421.1.p1 GENE.GHRR01000421.1~~GHRR01000421.1.p1  ORF type:complete len:199 (+),score=48.78 GHRR01000421.1:71-598(+)